MSLAVAHKKSIEAIFSAFVPLHTIVALPIIYSLVALMPACSMLPRVSNSANFLCERISLESYRGAKLCIFVLFDAIVAAIPSLENDQVEVERTVPTTVSHLPGPSQGHGSIGLSSSSDRVGLLSLDASQAATSLAGTKSLRLQHLLLNLWIHTSATSFSFRIAGIRTNA
ncbi:hypothetical protein BJ170DRAFT_598614 [Xylariales sp. AK1849]|nr:hypothetical protein BJ170DRAFT_598614 [Xylariales sp. AK1849]